jgi:hypothetical protein
MSNERLKTQKDLRHYLVKKKTPLILEQFVPYVTICVKSV